MKMVYSNFASSEKTSRKDKKKKTKQDDSTCMNNKIKKSYKQIRSQNLINQNKYAFEHCKLTYEQFSLFDYDTGHEYLQRALDKKYQKPIRFTCSRCAINKLYDLKGEVTDEELEESTNR